MKDHYQVLVIGGGAAGITVSARLKMQSPALEVAILEPSDKHYYQPIWTLVGGGVFPREVSIREEADFIPEGVEWIKDAAQTIDPENNTVTTKSGAQTGYDYLVVCPGIQINWDALPGLAENIGKNGVCSNYSYEHAEYTWECIKNFDGGRAVFTQPATPIKCGGAPQKIMYLAADHFRKNGLLDKAEIDFFTPGGVIFGVKKFADTLHKVIDRYGINAHFQNVVTEIRGNKKEVVVTSNNPDNPGEQVVSYDILHVTPPQSAPDFIRTGPLVDAAGWVDVDKNTMQHKKYPNVFSLGDASNLPTAKTGAAVRKQAPIVADHLLSMVEHGKIVAPKSYNGYSSCPLVTGYGKLVLAEFDYNNDPDPSFPFDTSRERYSMYALKAYGLPDMYWHGMLRGRV